MSRLPLKLSAFSLKEGRNHGFDPPLSKSSLAHIGAYFESWVKLLGPPLFISQTLREY